MKKVILSTMAIALSTQAIFPLVAHAEQSLTVQQMSQAEKVQKIKAAREALSLLEQQLKEAQAARDGRWALKIRNGALIAAGITGAITVFGLVKMTGNVPGNNNTYLYGNTTLKAALVALASLVVAGGSQGVLYFTDDEVRTIEAKIKSINDSLERIEASVR